jgi:hypothetical protein
MFVCKSCLAEHYDWPKWDDTFSRSYGPCEICSKVFVCVDTPHDNLVLKNGKTEWACASQAPCSCPPIQVGDEVVEVRFDVLNGVRFHVTVPDPKAHNPLYTRSFHCATEILKHFLQSKWQKS